jgi:hypothetical protein
LRSSGTRTRCGRASPPRARRSPSSRRTSRAGTGSRAARSTSGRCSGSGPRSGEGTLLAVGHGLGPRQHSVEVGVPSPRFDSIQQLGDLTEPSLQGGHCHTIPRTGSARRERPPERCMRTRRRSRSLPRQGRSPAPGESLLVQSLLQTFGEEFAAHVTVPVRAPGSSSCRRSWTSIPQWGDSLHREPHPFHRRVPSQAASRPPRPGQADHRKRPAPAERERDFGLTMAEAEGPGCQLPMIGSKVRGLGPWAGR